MKTLIDGSKVSSGLYFYLFEFNNKTENKFMEYYFKKSKLSDLTLVEFHGFCYYAAQINSECL